MKILLIANLYSRSDMQRRVEVFESALTVRNLDYKVLDPMNFNEANFDFNSEYSLIRLSSDFMSIKLDALIRPKVNKDCTSYIRRSYVESLYDMTELNFVKTIDFVSTDLNLLGSQVEMLGGFPLILKENSSSKGIGVMKIDSHHGLVSKLDFLRANNFYDIQLKEFFPHTSQLRVLIAYGKLITAMEYFVGEDDFRTNVIHNKFKRKRRLVKPRADILDNCFKYARLRGADIVGVDVLINQNDYRLIEGNAPCNFLAINSLTNGKVPGLIIDALLAKQNNEVKRDLREFQAV